MRWQEREAASSFPAAAGTSARPSPIEDARRTSAELAGFRSVWDAPEVEFSPALEFLFPRRELVS